jgi:hypothetical protein
MTLKMSEKRTGFVVRSEATPGPSPTVVTRLRNELRIARLSESMSGSFSA